ncbi:conserved hypothetical protein [Ricinus communis]|uniref:Uncharacterized protein n=1 Tax=Ricinus communis TaxID=3988 RepID=B9SVU0_RICCO|nr:conserved hypothetical protein [Ricinus communis]
MALCTAPRIKPPAMNPMTKSRINDHNIGFGRLFFLFLCGGDGGGGGGEELN